MAPSKGPLPFDSRGAKPTGERNRRMDALFAEALDLPPRDREQFLLRACGEDDGLRRDIEELLAASELDDTFLEPGGAAHRGLLSTLIAPVESPVGQTLGRYRVIEEIGRGGMGVVYLAQRADGQFEQRVALKLLLVHSDPAAVERFSRERQILANLEHPRIARLIDGGLTDSGQPFLVMEYVAGLPIDRFCRQHRLGLEQRITLLTEVCDAVEAAHRQLIVHRDLKPSNILVRDDGELRLLDFGIAKLMDPGPGGQTQTLERFLTPQYASPEQVRGGRITVASDVYQLGLLAFELFSGRRPYNLAGLSAAEAERKVCDEVPRRPSTASRSRSDEQMVSEDGYRPDPSLLTGDLDLILLKALHKDPERRYGSAEAFRLDLQRFLAGLPISARPDVWTYRLRKFVGRHRWAITAGLATLTMVTVLVAGFVWRLAEERDQTHLEALRAEERRAETEEVTSFLIGLFEASTPFSSNFSRSSPGSVGADTTARELLAQGRQRLDGAFPDQPLVHARLLQAVGRIYRNLELFDEADPLLTEALDLRREVAGDQGPDLAESFADVGSVLAQTGREQEAEDYYRESLARFVAQYGEHHREVARAQGNLANLLHRLGKFEESESLLTLAVETSQTLESPDELRSAWLMNMLARSRLQKGEAPEAHQLFERALEIRRRILGPDNYWVSRSLVSVALSHYHQGRYQQAIPLYREALRILELHLGPDSTRVASVLENLAHSLHFAGQGEQTQAMMERALEIHVAAQGEESANAMRLRYNLAHLRLLLGDAAEAEKEFRRLQPIQKRVFDGPTEQSAMTWNGLGEALVAQGRADGVEDYFRRCEAQLLSLFGPKTKKLATPLLNRGRLARRRDDLATAEPLFRRAYDILQANLSPEADLLGRVRLELAELLREMGKSDEAAVLAAQAPSSPAAPLPAR